MYNPVRAISCVSCISNDKFIIRMPDNPTNQGLSLLHIICSYRDNGDWFDFYMRCTLENFWMIWCLIHNLIPHIHIKYEAKLIGDLRIHSLFRPVEIDEPAF